MPTETLLLFEGFTLDLGRLRLRGPSGPVDLRRKSFDVLHYLLEHAGRVVRKDELMRAVWPDVMVSDESLTQCISDIRRALGDKGQRVIKTVARRGYLVDVPVVAAPISAPNRGLHSVVASGPTECNAPSPLLLKSHLVGSSRDAPLKSWAFKQSRQRRFVAGMTLALGLTIAGSLIWTGLRAPSSVAHPTMMAAPTVAILPFIATGSVDSQRSLAAGIEAEVRSELTRALRGFDLIIRPAEAPKPAWWSNLPMAQPRSRYVVTGTSWVDTGGQRANVRLVETDTNRQVWSESFDLDPGQNGIFNRVPARIARLLVIQIQVAESRLPLPASPEAGHYALLGRAVYEAERGPDGTRKAQALFEKALNLDADSVPALQGFAITKVAQALNAWIPADQRLSTLAEASEAIDRSIRLDPRNASGHVVRGAISRALGEVDKAIASLEYALSLNPNFYAAHSELAAAKTAAGRAPESFRHIEEALQLAPPEPNIQILYFNAGYAALHVADDRAAVKWFLKARQTNPAYPNTALWLAAAYLGIGEDEAARVSLAEYLREKPRFSIEGFRRFVPTSNPVVAKQQERIIDAWRRLGVPESSPPQQAPP